MRIGFGNDIHRLAEGRALMLGGIRIPSERGEIAHSDGDVLIHALIDAILGAFALGDIGAFFPPSNVRWKDADSKALLNEILKLTKPEIINIDAVITLEKPKLRGHIDDIRESLSELLSVDKNRISVKAKTNEGLGDIGQGLAVKAECILLVGND